MNNLFKIDNKARKRHKKPLFNLGGGARFSKKLAQNLFATTVCIAMVLLGIPTKSLNYVAAATPTVPYHFFIEMDTLTDLAGDDYKTGFLTGKEDDLLLRVQMGKLSADVQYLATTEFEDGLLTKLESGTPITWLVTGIVATTEGEGSGTQYGLVLMSEAPLRGTGSAQYGDNISSPPVWSAEYGTLGGSDNLSYLDASFWGSSYVRRGWPTNSSLPPVANDLSAVENALLRTVTVTTTYLIGKTGVGIPGDTDYTTQDVFYAPRVGGDSKNMIALGGSDDLLLAPSYLEGWIWTRQTSSGGSSHVDVVGPGGVASAMANYIYGPTPAAGYACHVDLNKVLFASAPAANAAGATPLTDTPSEAVQTLRIVPGDTSPLGATEVTPTVSTGDAAAGGVTYTKTIRWENAPTENARLVVVASDGTSTYQFVRTLGADTGEIDLAKEYGKYFDGEFGGYTWIERDIEDNEFLTEATAPVDFLVENATPVVPPGPDDNKQDVTTSGPEGDGDVDDHTGEDAAATHSEVGPTTADHSDVTPTSDDGAGAGGDGANVKTGDTVTTATVAGLGLVLVLALGVMLRLVTSKKKI